MEQLKRIYIFYGRPSTKNNEHIQTANILKFVEY